MYRDENIGSTVTNKLLRVSFSYMVLGLLITFLIPTYIILTNNSVVINLIAKFYTPIIIVEFITVMVFSFRLYKTSLLGARLMFFFYSFLNGLVFTIIGLTVGNLFIVAYSLLLTIIMFTVIAAYGYITSEDLTNYGGYLKTGIITLIIMSIINIFWRTPMLYWAVTVLGVVVFSALIAFDVNRIKRMSYEVANGDEEIVNKLGIMGALQLYLDFINLFIYILRIFSGKRK